ncbi:MAG TPA: DEAD/DEAH box helicase [Pseudomonadales bacterium]
MSDQNPTITAFAELQLRPEILSALESIGYETPSPIQAQAIPHLLAGEDILGVAQTGTGKTAAFALPLLSRLNDQARGPQILVLAPTRELAIQVAEAFTSYGKHIKGFKVLPIYGGQDYRTQLRQLERGVQVVVGTPGRVMDHIRRGTLDLSTLNALVLDEADEMLRMGFIDDVEWILEQMPDQHQTALFSATMPAPIRRISQKYLNTPVEITIKVKTTTAETIRQRYWQVKGFEKLDVLTRILEVEEFDGIIVFVRTKNATAEVAEKLQARGYAAEALNGDVPQAQREKVVSRLKRGQLDILVATDVAARGLDVERISHVINYDIPYDTESYVHRIGRTGRAGRQGDAILFVTNRERNMLGAIEKATRQPIEKFRFPSVDDLNQRKLDQFNARVNEEQARDLTEYHSVVKKFLQQNPDTEPQDLAAALASLLYGSKPFYLREQALPQESFSDKKNERRERKEKDRPRDGERRERSDSRETREPRERRPRPAADQPMERYRLAVGEVHGVRKGDIVGAIANEAGIDSAVMGKIRINEDHSFIELPEGMPKALLKKLRTVWVRGQQLQIRLDQPAGQSASPYEARPRHGKENSKENKKPRKRPAF